MDDKGMKQKKNSNVQDGEEEENVTHNEALWLQLALVRLFALVQHIASNSLCTVPVCSSTSHGPFSLSYINEHRLSLALTRFALIYIAFARTRTHNRNTHQLKLN